jgi:RimJ/RimL family protein N-acetyltransferase
VGHPAWPLFGLEVRTPRLTLRALDDDLAEQLLVVAAEGIHDPATMPFSVPWTDLPTPEFEQSALRFYWSTRAATGPDSWRLLFAVVVGGRVVGQCDLFATDFPSLRQFETGSWLGSTHQGHGFGKEMRFAALTLGFDGFDAVYALTGAWHDNRASLGVTASLGYSEVGRRRILRRDQPDEMVGFRMDRTHWATIRRNDVILHGLEPAKAFLGL